MPNHRQGTVERAGYPQRPPPQSGPGASDITRLGEMFPASPIYKGELTPEVLKTMAATLIQGGEVNDGGHTFGATGVNRDYTGAPDVSQVKVGPGGLPGSPYAPQVGSPGPGSINPADLPFVPPRQLGGSASPRGDGLMNPVMSSGEIAKQSVKDENLISGKSFKESDVGTK